MPYKNVPEDLWPDMEACVAKVKEGGKDEEAAIAICYASIVEGKEAKEPALVETLKATWTAAQINDFPDASFAFIESGGEKDEGGKTTPRGLRHLPYKDAGGALDLPHLRNAISRLGQPDTLKGILSADEKTALQEKLQKILDDETAKAQKGTNPLPLDQFVSALRRYEAI